MAPESKSSSVTNDDNNDDDDSDNNDDDGDDMDLAPILPPTSHLVIPFQQEVFQTSPPSSQSLPSPTPEYRTVRLPGGAPLRVSTRTLTVSWRPPPTAIMSTFTRLISQVASFEEYLEIPDHLKASIDYCHIESMWNYHMLTDTNFHHLYYKPSLDRSIPGNNEFLTMYRFYYRYFATLRQMMELHTSVNSDHLMTFYIGGKDRVLSMLKVHGDYRRPFVKLFAETIMFNRSTMNTLAGIPLGRLRMLCFTTL